MAVIVSASSLPGCTERLTGESSGYKGNCGLGNVCFCSRCRTRTAVDSAYPLSGKWRFCPFSFALGVGQNRPGPGVGEVSDISDPVDSRPVLGKDSLAVGVSLDLGNGGEPGPFGSKVDSPDSCEE